MHLRDERRRIQPNTGPGSTLMISRGPANVRSMVGGRRVGDGVVDRSLTVRTYSERPGRVRFIAKATHGPVRVAATSGKKYTVDPGRPSVYEFATGAGTNLETLTLNGGRASQNTLRVSELEYREGNGPWRSIK
jgi:hypothetical protein